MLDQKNRLRSPRIHRAAAGSTFGATAGASDAGGLDGSADLAPGREADATNRTLALARAALAMDVAFVAEFADGGRRTRLRALDGDAGSFRLREGSPLLEGAFCRRVVDGTLPGVVPDARDDGRVSGLAVTREADIGSYAGLPLRFSGGRLYGALCCLSHSPRERLRERDARSMGLLARLVAEQIEREEAGSRRPGVGAAGALPAALGARDGRASVHSEPVVGYAVGLARRMGLPEGGVAEVERAALLHCVVGKDGVGDPTPNKSGTLDDSRWEVTRAHPMIGEGTVSSTEGAPHLAPALGAEHEHRDGKGHPDRLSGGEVPLVGRIVLVCDAFHAMTSERPYRKALGVEAALSELRKNAGARFCPRTVGAFLGMVDDTLGSG